MGGIAHIIGCCCGEGYIGVASSAVHMLTRNLSSRWAKAAGSLWEDSVVLDGDLNLICLGTTAIVTDPNLYKFDVSGTELWKIYTGCPPNGQYAGVDVDDDGNIYCVAYDAILGAGFGKFDPDGNLVWLHSFDFMVSVRQVGTDSYITGGDADGSVCKIDSTPALVWGYSDDVWPRTGVDVDGDGNVYAAGPRDAGNSRSIIKLNSGGNFVWGYDTGDGTHAVAVDGDGANVYVVGVRSGSRSVWKINAAGVFQWGYDTGGTTWDVSVGASGDVYVVGDPGVDDMTVWKLDPDGNLLDSRDLSSTGYGVNATYDNE